MLSSQAGAVLMKDYISRLNVAQTLDQEIDVKERERGYSVSEGILGLAFNLMLGGDCLDDLDVLRGDPGTIAIFGVKNIIAPRTAGDLLRCFQIGDLRDFLRALRTIADLVRRRQTSEICTIDLDASIFEQRSTRKEGRAALVDDRWPGRKPQLGRPYFDGQPCSQSASFGCRDAGYKRSILDRHLDATLPPEIPLN